MAIKETDFQPHDLQAEMAVLGALLLDPAGCASVLGMLSPSDFFHSGNAIIFEHMQALAKSGKPIDLTVLAHSLTSAKQIVPAGGWVYLANLEQAVLSTSAAPEHASIVKRLSSQRCLVSAAFRAIREAGSDNQPPHEVAGELARAIYGIVSAKSGGFSSRVFSDAEFERLIQMIEGKAVEDDSLGIVTGIDCLAGVFGDVKRTDLVVIGARPSIGKTAFMLQLTHELCAYSGRPGLILELEMSRDELQKRMLAIVSNVALFRIKDRKRCDDRQLADILKAGYALQDWPLQIDEDPGLNVAQIAAKIQIAKQNEPSLSWVAIDHGGLIDHGLNKGENVAYAIGRTTRALKGIAKKERVTIFLLYQLSKETDKRGDRSKADDGNHVIPAPSMADLRDTGRVEEDADKIWLLHRQKREKWKRQDGSPWWPPGTPRICEMDVLVEKNRDGECGAFTVAYNLSTQRIMDPRGGARK